MKIQREILIVEGDIRFGAAMAEALTRAGFSCALASSGREALACAERTMFDLAVVGTGLTDPDGPHLLSRLWARRHYPAVAVCPSEDEDELIRLLDAGAVDYLWRPCDMAELVARVRLQLRRGASARPQGVLRHRGLVLDPDQLRVSLDGAPLNLTKREYRILELMLSWPPGRVFSKEDICERAWGDDFEGTEKAVNVHICNIRRKMRAITRDEYIETIWGFGYRLG